VNTGTCTAAFETLNAAVCPVLLTIDGRTGTELAAIWEDCESYNAIL
jgi:hypothetical protein